GPGGSIDPSGVMNGPSGFVNVICGNDQTFSILPNPGFSIADVTVDGVSVGAVSSYTFPNVRASHDIAATFTQITHIITASAGAGGSINPSGPVTVNDGADQ